MILGLFGGKSDHPLADARELRRVLDSFGELPAGTALVDATRWLESITGDDAIPLERRFSLVSQLDEALQVPARRAARDYLTAPRLGRNQELQLWQGNHAFWLQLSRAYEACLDRHAAEDIKSRLPLLVVRLLRALAAQLKWDQLRYGPLEAAVWSRLGRAYLCAESGRFAQRPVVAYAQRAAETTAQQEYLKALVFHASSMNGLMPLEIELAERLIAHLLPLFVFTHEARPDNVYWVDCAQPLPPTRLAKPPAPSPTLRFFHAGGALARIAELSGVVDSGEVPPDLDLGGQYSAKAIAPVLRHLALYWAARPPMRSHGRHRVKSRLAVVHGLARVFARLGAEDHEESEAWVVEDVSLGGMSAQLPLSNNDWLRVGSLLGLQPEGGDNWLVGVVRRFYRNSEAQGAVGIETLSKAPTVVRGDLGGMVCEAVALDPLQEGETTRVVLPARAFEPVIPLEFIHNGHAMRLEPLALVERGADFDIGRYRLPVS